MNRQAAIRNALNTIEFARERGVRGLEFSTADVMNANRILELADRFPAELTEEEGETLKRAYTMPFSDNWRRCRCIKEARNISWGELKMIAAWCR